MSGPPHLAVVDEAAELVVSAPALKLGRLPAVEALILSKSQAGMDEATAAAARALVQLAGSGRLGRPKYLVLDFAHAPGAPSSTPADQADIARELGNLVLKAPVVPVALARGPMGGPDLELAFSCSMVIAEQDVVFDFDVDPAESLGLYALLAQKIGFVRTERLMEAGEQVDAEAMKALLLVRDTAPAGEGMAFLEGFLEKHLRRHNSFHSIYRAQRMVSRPVPGDMAANG